VDFDKARGLFRTFANHFEASYEDTEPTLYLEVIDLHCNDKLRSQLKGGLRNLSS
jgi:hypothetical protein